MEAMPDSSRFVLANGSGILHLSNVPMHETLMPSLYFWRDQFFGNKQTLPRTSNKADFAFITSRSSCCSVWMTGTIILSGL